MSKAWATPTSDNTSDNRRYNVLRSLLYELAGQPIDKEDSALDTESARIYAIMQQTIKQRGN